MSFARVTSAPWVAIDYLNETESPRDIDYASATAPGPCYIVIEITRADAGHTRAIVDGVHVAAGGSHSWWTGAHGKLLRRGLAVGERMRVIGTAPFAFRWDWMDE